MKNRILAPGWRPPTRVTEKFSPKKRGGVAAAWLMFATSACNEPPPPANSSTSGNDSMTSDDDDSAQTEVTTWMTDGEQPGLYGRAIVTHYTDLLPIEVPESALSFFVPETDGTGVIKSAVFSADGTFELADIRPGPYAIYQAGTPPRFDFFPGAQELKLSREVVGRPDRQLIAAPEDFIIEVSAEHAPIVEDSTSLILRSEGARMHAWGTFSSDLVGEPFTNAQWQGLVNANTALVDASKGDRIEAMMMRKFHLDGFDCYLPTHVATDSAARFSEDAVNMVQVDFAPMESTLRDFYVDLGGLQGLLATTLPSAQIRKADFASIFARQNVLKYSGPWNSSCYSTGDLPLNVHVQLTERDHAPINAARWVRVALEMALEYQRPDGSGTIPDQFSADFSLPMSQIGIDGKISLPLVAAMNIRVTPSADATDALPWGTQPEIAWDAPLVDAANYTVDLLAFRGDAVDSIVRINTSSTSLIVPPNLFAEKDFVVQIYTRNWSRAADGTFPNFDFAVASIPTVWATTPLLPPQDDDSTLPEDDDDDDSTLPDDDDDDASTLPDDDDDDASTLPDDDDDDASTVPDDDDDDDSGECFDIVCLPGVVDSCAAGQKCSPYRCGDGCCTDTTHCVELTGSKQLGETCTRDASAGRDDCAATLFCFPDGQTTVGSGPGKCMQFCDPSSVDSNQCDEVGITGGHCFAFNHNTFPVCVPTCDPLQPECEDSQGCFFAVDNYFCADPSRPLTGDGGQGSQCNTEQGCQSGFACVDKELLADCQTDSHGVINGCCSRYCEVSIGECPLGLTCIDLPGDAPGRENVGACGTPR